jgi:flagellar motor switch protein FliM
LQTPLELLVSLGSTEITPRQLLNLEEGDILLFDNDTEEPLLAEVEGIPKFYGNPGQKKGNKAFIIRKEYSPEDES